MAQLVRRPLSLEQKLHLTEARANVCALHAILSGAAKAAGGKKPAEWGAVLTQLLYNLNYIDAEDEADGQIEAMPDCFNPPRKFDS